MLLKKTSEELIKDINDSIGLLGQANSILRESWQSESAELFEQKAVEIYHKMFSLSEETEHILKKAVDQYEDLYR